MIGTRMIIALAISCVAASSGIAQERKSRKVFTNEDVAAPAPAVAPAVASAAKPMGAKAPETSSATGDRQTGTMPAANEQSGPETELQKAMELQQVLHQNAEEYQDKIAKETDAARKALWTKISQAINDLMQQNQQVIENMSREMQQNSSRPGTPTPS